MTAPGAAEAAGAWLAAWRRRGSPEWDEEFEDLRWADFLEEGSGEAWRRALAANAHFGRMVGWGFSLQDRINDLARLKEELATWLERSSFDEDRMLEGTVP